MGLGRCLRLLLALLGAAAASVAMAQPKNVEVTRTIDLAMAVVRGQADIRASGVEGGSYVVSFPVALAPRLAFLQVLNAETDRELPLRRIEDG